MPQQPQTFDPNEFASSSSQAFDPNEFASKPALPAAEPSWFDTVSSYIPQPVKSAWDWASSPLTTLPSQAGKAVSDFIGSVPITQETGQDTWSDRLANVNARAKGFFQGASEGVGDFASSLTSPMSLATFGAGGVEEAAAQKGLPQLAKVAGLVSKGAGAPMVAHGAGELVNPASTMQQRAQGVFEMAGGAMPFAHTPGMPVKAPIEKAVEGTAEQLPVKQPRVREEIKQTIPYNPPSMQPKPKFEPLPIREGESISDYIRRNGVENIDTTPEEALANQARMQMTPDEGVNPPPATLDPEAQAVRDQTFNANTIQYPTTKPQVEFLDPATGELKSTAEAKPGDIPLPSNEVQGSTLPPEQATANEAPKPKLPANLAGGKPRFNIGTSSYIPQFASDLDKALYIIAQKNLSKHDAGYLKFAMEHTGLDENAARALGAEVKAAVKKAAVAGMESGPVPIPEIVKAKVKAAEAKPTQTPGEYLDGKSQVDTGELNPANAGVSSTAQEVTQKLSDRLKKVTEHPETAADEVKANVKDAEEVIKNANEQEKPGLIRQALGVNKALLTSWDLSAPGRQGKAFITNKAWWTSLDDMVKAWGSKRAADMVNQSIVEHPSGYFKPGEAGGKSFAEKMGLELTPHEEMFNTTAGKAVNKYLGIDKANRAHTAFLNKLRSDQFVSMMEAAKKAGLDPAKEQVRAKAYAKFINDATGRGSLNFGKYKLERNMNALNDVFFAPKNMSGQVRTWNAVLNPIKYANYDPVMRQQALRSLFAVAGTGLAVSEIAKMAGAQVTHDPTSSDFLKIKVGDTRVDPFGGYQQFPVAAMKFILGKSTSTTSGKTTDLTAGKYGQSTRGDVVERFFTNRLSPLGSFIWAWMYNKEFDGKPFEAKRALYERVFPIAAKDIVDLAKEDPALAVITAPSTMLGLTGTQTYTGR